MQAYRITLSSSVVIDAENETQAFGLLMEACQRARESVDDAQAHGLTASLEANVMANAKFTGRDVQPLLE